MKQNRKMEVHPIIRQIIDRDCHVSASNKEVVQHVISRFKHGLATFREMATEQRAQIIEQCVYHHAVNGKLYVDVMSGFTKTVTRPKRRLIASLSGKELVSLMRRHKVTIRELSERTKIPMKRIRELRELGIDDSFVLRDWMEAITGSAPGPMPRQIFAESESVCGLCGLPLREGELLFRWQEDVFCSLTCCENSGN